MGFFERTGTSWIQVNSEPLAVFMCHWLKDNPCHAANLRKMESDVESGRAKRVPRTQVQDSRATKVDTTRNRSKSVRGSEAPHMVAEGDVFEQIRNYRLDGSYSVRRLAHYQQMRSVGQGCHYNPLGQPED